jgi:hypothetical protein
VDNDSIVIFALVFALAGVLFGIVLIVRAFQSLKIRWQADHLPTATTRSIALGPVELKGVIGTGLEVADPVYSKPCVYYSVTVEHRILTFRDNSLSHEWITLSQERTGRRPFWLVDATGKALIWAQEAEMRIGRVIEFECGFFGSLFGSSLELAYMRKIKKQRVFFRRVRLLLHTLRAGHPVYVLGYAVRSEEVKSTNAAFSDALREAAAGERNRVIVRGPGEFIVTESEHEAAPPKRAIFLRVVVGMALTAISFVTLGFFWLMLRA